ncbi:MAG: alpha/beta hydrolase [Parafilimonas terrae]|nr:alpha/beta hydrolase [Parafilimonas terrae]
MRRVRAGVLDVAYRESGPPDGHPVILLHGFPYDVHAYEAVAPVLAKAGRRVIVPYLRGFGPTRFIEAATPRVGQQAALGNDLLALLDALDLRKATLAGFDWGARAACVVAALHPQRVSGLVSSGGPGYNIQNRADFLKPRDTAFERRHWFYWYLNAQRGRTAFSNDPAGFCRYLWHDFSPTWTFDDATFTRTAAAFENSDFVTVALHSYRFRIAEVLGDPALEPIEKRLSASPRITVPAIVLEGADEGVDPPEPPGTATPHFTQLRRTTVLNGVGHNAPQEAPDLFAAAILDLDR